MVMNTTPGKMRNHIFLSHYFDEFNSQITTNKFSIILVRTEDLAHCHLELVESGPIYKMFLSIIVVVIEGELKLHSYLLRRTIFS